jgi:RecB family endonuclease NucS
LKITDGGKEKTVESGRIDITAEDKNGATVVIELKAGEADRDAIGQILAYMGDLTTDKNLVRGILVAGEFSARAVAAGRVVPNLRLKKYSFNFAFEPVGSE